MASPLYSLYKYLFRSYYIAQTVLSTGKNDSVHKCLFSKLKLTLVRNTILINF